MEESRSQSVRIHSHYEYSLINCILFSFLLLSFIFSVTLSPGDGVDLRIPETLGEDEWSESWAEYQKECAAEEEDAKARGITEEDVKNQTAPDPVPNKPKPLSQGKRVGMRDGNLTRQLAIQY